MLAFPINVGRPKSVQAVEEALQSPEKLLGIFAQKEAKVENPTTDELYQVGTVVKILKTVKVPLPTLATQRAIVAEVEAEQALVASNQELVEPRQTKRRREWF